MATPNDSVQIRSLIWRMFREPADADYICARAMAFLEQPYLFYWNASQAIEKYLKCILLQNNLPVSEYSHNLERLLTDVNKIAGTLIPIMLIPPKEIDPEQRHLQFFAEPYSEPFSDFVIKVMSRGNPDNRYRHYSLVYRSFDLHKLDECCFILRRLCFPLQMNYAKTDHTYFSLLAADPNFHEHLPLFSTGSEKTYADWKGFAERYNFSYFPVIAREQGKYLGGGTQFVNSAIYLAIESKEVDTLEWALEKLRFARSDRTELLTLLQDMKQA